MNQDSQAEPRVIHHFDDADYPSVTPIESNSGLLTEKEIAEWKEEKEPGVETHFIEETTEDTPWRASAESIRRHCLATAGRHARASLEELVASLEFYELFDQGLADRRQPLIDDLQALIDELEKQERTRR